MHCFKAIYVADVWQGGQSRATAINFRTIHKIKINTLEDKLYLKVVFFQGWSLKRYGRGQRLQPHRWWCPQAEAPGLRQTGWSSVTSAGTETPPSRDCGPSEHATPVIQKQAYRVQMSIEVTPINSGIYHHCIVLSSSNYNTCGASSPPSGVSSNSHIWPVA